MTFYRRKTDFYEKKSLSLCRLSNIVVGAITFFPFNLKTCSFQVSIFVVLCGAYCFFNHSTFEATVRLVKLLEFE
jgi:hypothetical protein